MVRLNKLLPCLLTLNFVIQDLTKKLNKNLSLHSLQYEGLCVNKLK